MKKNLILLMAIGILSATASFGFQKPVTIKEQGSFMAGGTVVTSPGEYKDSEPMNFDGETLHGDHAYVFYQKPMNAKKNSIVFLHGYGQSGKSWETTPDGRDGFQNIFLEKGYNTYIVDQPRRGRAGQSTVARNLTARPDDQLWYNNFRIGQWPGIYDNVSVPRDNESREQFFRQMTPDTGDFDQKVISDAMVKVFEKSGNGVLVTHSAGGGPGWDTAIKSDKVKGVIALEPGTFPFPKGKLPKVEKTTSPFPASGYEVSDEEFKKLTKVPIVVYFGDNIPTEITDNWGLDNWRIRVNLARKWEKMMNEAGGDVKVVMLPDIGIKGSTHFMMADLNNREVANAMEKWMKEKGLAK